jgi:hypothetical protein
MKSIKRYTLATVILCTGVLTAVFTFSASAQRPGDRPFPGSDGVRHEDRSSPARIVDTVRRVENHSDAFRKMVDKALDRSYWNNTRREDRINARVKDFDTAIDSFRKDFDRHRNRRDSFDYRAKFRNVLVKANAVDQPIHRLRLPKRVTDDWGDIRGDLNRIADFYNLPQVGARRILRGDRFGNHIQPDDRIGDSDRNQRDDRNNDDRNDRSGDRN